VRQSDFLTLVRAFEAFRAAAKEGSAAEARFCSQHFLSRTVLREMQDLKCQFMVLLMDLGLVQRPADFKVDGVRNSYGALEAFMGSRPTCNAEARNTNLVTAVIAAGLYPHVVRATTHTGGVAKPSFAHGPAERPGSTVFLHGSSVNQPLTTFSSPWLVFHERFETARAYVHPTSVVSPYALLLFGGPLAVDHLSNRVTVDDWIDFACPARTAVLFREMRRRLNEVLEELIRQPLVAKGPTQRRGQQEESHHEVVVDTIVDLLKEEAVKAAWVPGSKDDPDRNV
jgi:hypothetical protein